MLADILASGAFAPTPTRRTLLARQPVFAALLTIIAGLVGISLLQDVLIYRNAVPDLSGKIWRLDVDVEQSVYTWFSSSLILANAVLLAFITLERSSRADPLSRHWAVLACVFVVLSADEALSLHEWLSGALGRRMDNGGIFYFFWVVPALLACLAGVLAYLPFIRSFPSRSRLWLIASALLFVSGAVGTEMLGGRLVEQHGIHNLGYRMLSAMEEGLEGADMAMFLFTLLLYREERGRMDV